MSSSKKPPQPLPRWAEEGFDKANVLDHLLGVFHGMVYLRRQDGRFLIANHQAVDFYHCSPEYLQFASLEQLSEIRPEATNIWQQDDDVIRTGKTKQYDECFRNSAGREQLYHTIKVPYCLRSDGRLQFNDPSGHYDAVLSLSIESTDDYLAARQIRNQTSLDLLTGLANRNLLRRRIKQSILETQRMGTVGALLLLELENFREINEVFGHISGELLLKQVSEAFTAGVGDAHVLARMSGDEFALLICETEDKEKVSHIAQGLLEHFKAPFRVNDQRIILPLSIGISFFPEDADNYGSLLKHADLALSYAKQASGSRCQDYSSEMNHSLQRRRVIANDLRNALDEDVLALYYQPIISTQTGEVVGMEALLRWYDGDKPVFEPSEFIPIAEQTGLIVPIGDWVIRRAIQEQQAWLERQSKAFLAVNLSTVQFQQADLGGHIGKLIRQSGLDPRFLELEITESTIMQDMDEAIETMHQFYDIGLGLAIDDFGTGYSSLSYLKRFPINKIKIDQSFVNDIGEDSDSENITEAIINLGHSLGLQVVAEGVELERHVSFLKGARADLLQGFHYARPLPARAFHEWVVQYHRQLPKRRRDRPR